MPRFESASATGRVTPRSAKDILGALLVLCGGNPETRTHSLSARKKRNSSSARLALDAHERSREAAKPLHLGVQWARTTVRPNAASARLAGSGRPSFWCHAAVPTSKWL